jgi:predicted  nucleic acid-binding Zn-ribbon protein
MSEADPELLAEVARLEAELAGVVSQIDRASTDQSVAAANVEKRAFFLSELQKLRVTTAELKDELRGLELDVKDLQR